MASALFAADDYRQALLSLLPRGRVWPKDPGTTQDQLMTAFAQSFERLDARAQTLLVDLFPATTLELLPEWEATLGLPDPCEGEDQTIEQRRGQVVSRLLNAGGQSQAYFLGVLARLGYTGASITQYAPFRAGVDRANTPLYGPEWIFHWTINLPELRVFYFRANASAAGEALFTISDDAVLCAIAALQPAHTTVDYTANP